MATQDKAGTPAKTRTRRKKPPKVRARSRATIRGLQEKIEQAYLEKHPDKVIRWAFSPEHKPELNKVWKWQVEGYTLIDPVAEELELPHGVSGNTVRIGDLVMMAQDVEDRAAADEDLKAAAIADSRKSTESYYESMRGLVEGPHSGLPTGDIRDSEEIISPKEPK